MRRLGFSEQNEMTSSQEMRELIQGLLRPKREDRTKFSLIMIQPLLKKYPTIPHVQPHPPQILPTTIFSCPPSEHYKEQYFKRFLKDDREKGNERAKEGKTNTCKEGNVRSYMVLNDPEEEGEGQGKRQKMHFRTQNDLKSSSRTLSENKVYIEEFVDISHVYGYGYQMNTGTICFTFNDQTSLYYPHANTKVLRYFTDKKPELAYQEEKFPEEEDMKKKKIVL